MLNVPTSCVPQSCPGLGTEKIENNLFCPVPTFYENNQFFPVPTFFVPSLGHLTLLSFIAHGTSNLPCSSLSIFQTAEIYQQFPSRYVSSSSFKCYVV